MNTKMKNILLCLLLCGCSIQYRGKVVIPNTPQELKEFIAKEEAQLEALEDKLSEHKESRQSLIEASKHETTSFLENSYGQRIDRINTKIDFTMTSINWTKQDLAKAKERMKSFELKE